ncbi:30S ribosomal protein S9 [Candidatus Woesearchaeota archaeon]|nr:30S ribosomal protein S9 [Candidatus Woesearchaeota archaeon]
MKSIITTGKRKEAIARATLKNGTGKLKINNLDVTAFQPTIARLKLQEPLILAGANVDKIDISVTVQGGGFMGQTIAARLAIARALVEKFPKLKDTFLNYDRQLLVADVRRKEARKPNTQGNARAKRQKSYR